ncbi:sigma-70 family RNA polymerase sigma factor [Acetobacter sp. AN02]|uniref:sigma-70 family RNA polymerase sigma factor n=1 Tax=Acetobacter sp. AN02 TaxID=2894186 RepID=UPI00243431BC|nr:sigma-70 family RNA polymerase sigma factor [Acetobacter sp. AN02]MDG6093976.1 sigma-70 family RNA polymerase sigma factor [Acetobacter sp. AN02]
MRDAEGGIKTTENQNFRGSLVSLLPALRGFARFLTHDPVRADDLVQETIVRALAAQDQFTEGTSQKAWMFTILRNLFFEQVRRHRREAEVMDEAEAGISLSHAPRAVIQDDIRDLDRMLRDLPPRMREALILVAAQGMSCEEVALITGVAVGTVKARVSRARRLLSEQRAAGGVPSGVA